MKPTSHNLEIIFPMSSSELDMTNDDLEALRDLLKSLAENPEQRCFTVVIVDCSGSMAGPGIEDVNTSLIIYADGLQINRSSAERIVICVGSVGGRVRDAVKPTPANKFVPPTLTASGDTPMAEVVLRYLKLIRMVLTLFHMLGIDYQPCPVIIVSDGAATSLPEDLAEMTRQFQKMVADRSIIPIIVASRNGDINALEKLFGVKPIDLSELKSLAPLFTWFSQSVVRYSMKKISSDIQFPDPHKVDWTKYKDA